MQHAKATFTGRARRTRPHPWVKVGDGLARAVITLGGIGTIVAVLLVGVFLLTVALPLFLPTSARHDRTLALGADGPPAVLAADETGSVVLDVQVAGASPAAGGEGGPGVRLISAADGRTLLRLPLANCGLAGATVIRALPGTGRAVVGYADGSLRIGRIGIESTFVPAAAVPPVAADLAAGSAVTAGVAAILRGDNDRFARVAPVVELGPPTRVLEGRVVDADVTELQGGPLVAAIDAAGRVRIEAVSSRRNLLTDELVTTSSGATIEPEAGFVPTFVRVTELGDQLFLVAADGAARRYEIREVETPRATESFAAATPPARVTAVERLFGGSALAVGDDRGGVRVMFAARGAAAAATADGLVTHVAKTFRAASHRSPAVTAIASSPRSRLFAVADADGTVRLLQATTGGEVLRFAIGGPGRAPARPALAIAPRENRVLAAGGDDLTVWSLATRHPDVSPATLFGPVWYENYPRPGHAWETTGHESFESKFGLVPLVFGTLKATVYSMLFATPIAILAAIYASQFLHPRWKARIKPTIEMMASLPSVVLGFVAGLILAPLIERGLMRVVSGLFTVPLVLLAGAHLWQLLPAGTRSRFAPWRFPIVGLVGLPAGVAAAVAAAPVVERLLFQGDFRGWLDGRGGSGFGGWMLALLPLAGIAAATLCGRAVSPWLRERSAGWSERRAALVSLGVFVAGVVVALTLAAAGGALFDALRLDARGGLLGTYVQRNAMVVAIGMSFAIIPLVFTIADDALSSVPDHLRSASLGAGATPWQTAIRVIVPAATSGLFSAVMIGLGRAVGETMIVLMAAGNTPLIGWNLFNGFQTLSAAIATELPEAARGSTHYRVLFLAALTLFAMTFVVNTAAELVRQRFRKRAHEL